MRGDVEHCWREVVTKNDGLYQMTLSVEIAETEMVLKLLTTKEEPAEGGDSWRGLGQLVPSDSLRDSYLVRSLQESIISKVGTCTSGDKLWNMTLGIAYRPSAEEPVTLFCLVACELESRSSTISLQGHLSGWIGQKKEMDKWGRRAARPLTRWHGADMRTRAPVNFTEVHYTVVESLDKYALIRDLKARVASEKDCFVFDCDITAHIKIQRRFDLTSMGRGLQDNADLVFQIIDIGGLSLRDVQHLSLTSKAIKVSVADEVRLRLRKALAPYFPGSLNQLSSVLRENDAIIGGSTMLSVLKPGDWQPDDLDIILPDSSAGALESYLASQGYIKDAEREMDIPYVYEIQQGHPTPFRWRCFRKGDQKIDLCYTSLWSTPLSHVLSYHSTPVMNYFDGDAIHCLFPEQTFAGKYLNNNHYPGGTVRLGNALRKIKQRGFVEDGNVEDWLESGRWGEDLRLQDLPTIWRQVVKVEGH